MPYSSSMCSSHDKNYVNHREINNVCITQSKSWTFLTVINLKDYTSKRPTFYFMHYIMNLTMNF